MYFNLIFSQFFLLVTNMFYLNFLFLQSLKIKTNLYQSKLRFKTNHWTFNPRSITQMFCFHNSNNLPGNVSQTYYTNISPNGTISLAYVDILSRPNAPEEYTLKLQQIPRGPPIQYPIEHYLLNN